MANANPTYQQIKTTVKSLYGQYVKNKGFIESEAGDPTQLESLFGLVHSDIISFNQTFPFEIAWTDIDIKGREVIDLKQEVPGLISLNQVYNANEFSDENYYSNEFANVTAITGGYTVRNRVLKFTGVDSPDFDTITIQYKSQFLVEDKDTGNRKWNFENVQDKSVIPYGYLNVLITGISEYISWKQDSDSQQQKQTMEQRYQQAWANLQNYQEHTNSLDSFL